MLYRGAFCLPQEALNGRDRDLKAVRHRQLAIGLPKEALKGHDSNSQSAKPLLPIILSAKRGTQET